MATLYDFQVIDIAGDERKLSDFAGKVCLVVNVASECGLTPQYDGLVRLHSRYREQGFEILGFPCNQFGGQEPADEATIAKFCRRNFFVEFPMFSKIEVNGDVQHPLYAWLTSQRVGPDAAGDVAWNFAKFLVDAEGHLIARFAPTVEPEAKIIVQKIDEAFESR